MTSCAVCWLGLLLLGYCIGSCARGDAYAGRIAVRGGGTRQRSLASLLRFCAVAVGRTSSLTPLKPRSRNRSSLRTRFMCANRISTFLRSRRDCSKASVLAKARTRSRTSSSRSRVILRTVAVVHCGFSEHRSDRSCWPCSKRYDLDRYCLCWPAPRHLGRHRCCALDQR